MIHCQSTRSLIFFQANWIPTSADCTSASTSLSERLQGLVHLPHGWSNALMARWWSCRESEHATSPTKWSCLIVIRTETGGQSVVSLAEALVTCFVYGFRRIFWEHTTVHWLLCMWWFSCGNAPVLGSTEVCLATLNRLQRSRSKTLPREFLPFRLRAVTVAQFGLQTARVLGKRSAVGVAATAHVSYFVRCLSRTVVTSGKSHSEFTTNAQSNLDYLIFYVF